MARNEIDVAWAAGLFEGEGSCFVGSGQRQPIVAVVMTDVDVVERFAEIMGCGYVNNYRRPPNKRFWRWSVTGRDDVLSVLGLLWPYLGERRREAATVVIERATKMHDGRGFCKRGHDLSEPQHLYIHAKTGKRSCRTCRIARATLWTRERGRVPRPAA